jgi:hypothetical protein
MRGSWEVNLIKKYHIQINNDRVKQKSAMMRAISPRGPAASMSARAASCSFRRRSAFCRQLLGGGAAVQAVGLLKALTHPHKTIGPRRLPAILRH